MKLVTWLISRKDPIEVKYPHAFWGEYEGFPRMYFQTPEEANAYVKECMAKANNKLDQDEMVALIDNGIKKSEKDRSIIPELAAPAWDSVYHGYIVNFPDRGYIWFNTKKEAQKALDKKLNELRLPNNYQTAVKKITELEAKKRSEENQKRVNELIDVFSPLYKKVQEKSDIDKWRQRNLDILKEGRSCNLSSGDICTVALVTDTGNEHITGWKTWVIKNSWYDTKQLVFDVPADTTIIGIFVYKDSKVVMSNKISAQRFFSDGTYTVTLTYQRGVKQ